MIYTPYIEIIMRNARIEDIEVIHRIYMSPEVNPYMNFDLVSIEDFKPLLLECINDLKIIESEGNIIGVIGLTRMKNRRSHVLFLSKFAIAPEYNGKGYGSKVIKDIIKDAKSTGVKKIELMAEEDNSGAIEFYKKLGFAIEGKISNSIYRDGVMVDDYYMGITL